MNVESRNFAVCCLSLTVTGLVDERGGEDFRELTATDLTFWLPISPTRESNIVKAGSAEDPLAGVGPEPNTACSSLRSRLRMESSCCGLGTAMAGLSIRQ